MALTGKKLLAVDWDARDLRMAMVRVRGDRLDLVKAVSVPIPPDLAVDNAELLGAFIREAMKQSGLSAKHALMSIPRNQVVLNRLDLPPMPADDLPASIQFQIVKELPFAAEQATIDFAFALGHDPKQACQPLVAAIRNEDLEFYQRVAREAGLTIERLGLRPFANLRAVMGGLPELAAHSVLVVDVGPTHTEIDVIDRGTLAFCRAAQLTLPRIDAVGADRVKDSRITALPLLDAEQDELTTEAVGKLLVDVIRSYEAHRATAPHTSVDQIVVCGSTGLEAELAQSLAARFAAKAQLFSPDRLLDLSPQRAKELRGFSSVIGMAVSEDRPALEAFDFLRPKKPVSKRTKRLKKAPVAIGAAILVIGAGIWAHIRFVLPARASAESVRRSVERKQSIEKPYLEFIAQANALQEWKASEQYWPDVVAELSRVFPSDQLACVDRLDLDMRSAGRTGGRIAKLAMKLRVAESGTVNAISESLRSLGFKSVEPGSETPRGLKDLSEIYRFDTSVRAELPPREPRNWDDVDTDDADAAIEAEPDSNAAPSGDNSNENRGGEPSPARLDVRSATDAHAASPAASPVSNGRSIGHQGGVR
ncbi:MAG: pilus assembly protein PilM [Phycisphaerae bacterium]|nr:pilus assembly protein PilM [Phycisphaerae bacterium]